MEEFLVVQKDPVILQQAEQIQILRLQIQFNVLQFMQIRWRAHANLVLQLLVSHEYTSVLL